MYVCLFWGVGGLLLGSSVTDAAMLYLSLAFSGDAVDTSCFILMYFLLVPFQNMDLFFLHTILDKRTSTPCVQWFSTVVHMVFLEFQFVQLCKIFILFVPTVGQLISFVFVEHKQTNINTFWIV